MLTVPEAIEKIEKLDKDFTVYKAEAEAKIKKAEAEAEAAKKAEAEAKKAKTKKADAETEEERKAKFHKAMKAATEETDEEKKKEYMKEAMSHYKADDDPDKEPDKETEKEASLTAKITYLSSIIKGPQLKYLEDSYKGRVDDKTLVAYKTQWEKLEPEQLDAEIKKVQPFVAKTRDQTNGTTQVPLGFSTHTAPQVYVASKDEFSAKLKELSTEKLFEVKF